MKITRFMGAFTSVVMLSGIFTSAINAGAEETQYAGIINDGYVQLYTDENASSDHTETMPVLGASSLPSSYDLRDEDCVTPVKDQGAEGMCHAFAAIGACETNLLKQGLETDPDSLDLSEAQLGYFLYTMQEDPFDPCLGDYLNAAGKGAAGGNGIFAMAALAGGLGTQYEEYCPYKQWSSGYSEYNRYTGKYRLKSMDTVQQIYTNDEFDTIKSWIMESGGVGFAFYSKRSLYYDNGTSFSYYAPDNDFYEDANHAALIVGWDDDYSRENFADDTTPSGNGAWLVKNSYGVDYFDDGYFWISYEDPTMGSFCRYILEDADAYDDVYEYDGAGYIYGYNYDKAANIYTAEYDCTLSDAAFYIPSGNPAGTRFKAEVYILNSNTDDPTDGRKMSSTTLTPFYSGYKKVSLEEPVELEEGQQFSIVISASASFGGTTYLPIEEPFQIVSGFQIECHADKGESYVLEEGRWIDITNEKGNSGTLGNVPVKAFTVRNTQREPLQLQAALAAADASGIEDSTLAKAVSEGQAALNNGAGYRKCARTAQTILALLEKNGAVSYPEYIYEDYGVISGDSNNDGTISIADATAVLTAYSADGAEITYRSRKSQLIGMDIVSDGVIGIDDATAILTLYAEQGAGMV